MADWIMGTDNSNGKDLTACCFVGEDAETLIEAQKCGISTKRILELCRAEQDGRCVVLPCKVGDTVYLLDDGYGNPVEAEIDYWMTGKNGLIGSVVFGTGQRMKFIDRRIGKTVFLTREEAEAALKEVKQDG